MARWQQGTVVENQHWTDTLFSLRIEVESFAFAAGQFAKLALDLEGERIARPFSLVNPPDGSPLECYLVLVPTGRLSPVLHRLQAGDAILVSQQSAGFFTLDEVPNGDSLWMLASGTGVGPYLSILQTDTPWQRFARIHLVHSVRRTKELVYRSLIHVWQQRYPEQFRYQPIVTREPCEGALTQRLPALLGSGALERALGDRLGAGTQVMLCGNPQMVTDCLAELAQRGLKKNLRRSPGQVTSERYW